MTIKGRLKKIMTGLSIPQEYICLDLAAFHPTLSVFLSFRHTGFFQDVSSIHLFLGYKPVVISLMFKAGEKSLDAAKDQDEVLLSFQQQDFVPDIHWKGFTASRKSLARLILRKKYKKSLNGYTLLIFEGIWGKHFFINAFHQFINHQLEKRKKRKTDNISLPGNLYDQVRIAYSLPRVISIITVSDGVSMNMFPTDLHGPAGDKYYLGSLRSTGKANQQVEQYRRIVISNVNASWFKEAYGLGKNHMKDLTKEEEFPIHTTRSAVFGFPLPAGMKQYYELQLADSIDQGIHRIHLYEIVNYFTDNTTSSTLAHIHLYYCQWREDNHLPTNMLVRQ